MDQKRAKLQTQRLLQKLFCSQGLEAKGVKQGNAVTAQRWTRRPVQTRDELDFQYKRQGLLSGMGNDGEHTRDGIQDLGIVKILSLRNLKDIQSEMSKRHQIHKSRTQERGLMTQIKK